MPITSASLILKSHTDFMDVVQRNAAELGRRAALTVKTLRKNAFQIAIAGTDSSTTDEQLVRRSPYCIQAAALLQRQRRSLKEVM